MRSAQAQGFSITRSRAGSGAAIYLNILIMTALMCYIHILEPGRKAFVHDPLTSQSCHPDVKLTGSTMECGQTDGGFWPAFIGLGTVEAEM